jgi:hypothetical protein
MRNTHEREQKLGDDLTYVVGVDFGYNDQFALEVLGWRKHHRELWHVDEFAQSALIPSHWAEVIRRYYDRYQPIVLVADCGALGKPIAEEMRQRYHLPIVAAEKQRKASMIEVLNGELECGRFSVIRDSELARQMDELPWASGKTTEDPRYKNDCCDAALYAARAAMHYLQSPKAHHPEPGSDLWMANEEREMELGAEREQMPDWDA